MADEGYDADWLRTDLRKAGIVPVIPGTRSRKAELMPGLTAALIRRRI